jgi:serine/threonine-protein kinase
MLAGRAAFDFPTFTRICAELSTDRMPPSLTESRPEIPKALDAAVMRCFARSPAARHQDVSDLAGALLDAVRAPIAGSTRHRIASTLGRRDSPESLPAGALSGTSLLTTGSLSSKRMLAAARTGGSTLPDPLKRKGTPVVVAIVGVVTGLGLLAGGWFAARRVLAERPTSPAATATVAAPVQPIAPSARELPSASALPAESSAARAPSAANPVAEAPPSPERPVSTGGRGAPRSHVVRPTNSPASPSPVAAAPPATPAVSVVPAAPPPPTPAVKADPLGDRQ